MSALLFIRADSAEIEADKHAMSTCWSGKDGKTPAFHSFIASLACKLATLVSQQRQGKKETSRLLHAVFATGPQGMGTWGSQVPKSPNNRRTGCRAVDETLVDS